MSPKFWIMTGLVVGGLVGEMIPSLWGSDVLSLTSAFFSFLGGAAGIYIAFKLTR